MHLLHRPGDAQRLAVRGLVKFVYDQFRRVLVVEADHYRVPPAVKLRVVIVFPEERDAVPTDRPDLLAHHEEPELSRIDARPPLFVEDLLRASSFQMPLLRPLRVHVEPRGHRSVGLLQRQAPAACRLLMDLPVQPLPAFQTGGLCSMDVPV